MQHIETVTAGSAVASIEFTSIPQNYDDLLVVFSLSALGASSAAGGQFRINGGTADTSAIYLFGNGSSTGNGSPSFIEYHAAGTATANTFGNGQVYISNYTASTAKSISLDYVTENNATANLNLIEAALYDNASAITSVSFVGSTGDIVANSTASLYGISAGGSGSVGTA